MSILLDKCLTNGMKLDAYPSSNRTEVKPIDGCRIRKKREVKEGVSKAGGLN